TFRQLGLFGLVEMAIFIALVFVAYVYVWKKGGLDWAPSTATDLHRPEAGEPEDLRPEVAGAR
ncbi:MAG TPA: NADH-quinone oxidoreductase subunit A, partial [Actinomycetota bacterium]|nr:NADH-quinone oxidoreductase subunit A [Actinomycetota bacterium]